MAHITFISQPFENLAIEYLSAALKEKGHRVSVIIDPCLFNDAYFVNNFLRSCFDNKDKIIKEIGYLAPDLIAFSVLTDTYRWALDQAERLKDKYPDIPIIFGGIHPTLVPETVMENDCVDIACVGEGEEALCLLAGALDKKEGHRFIDNLWIREGKTIYKNKCGFFQKELDKLPFPDKSIFYNDPLQYPKEYLMMTSRGCPHNCSYCCNQALKEVYGNGHYRKRSVRAVINELETAVKMYSPVFIWFMDDSFVNDIFWLEEFSEAYSKKISLPFFCYVHCNDIKDKVIDLLRKANCYEIGLGVHTLSATTLLDIHRVTTPDNIKKAIRMISDRGILCIAENILGLPTESEYGLVKLGLFYNNFRRTIPIFSSLRLFPRTKLLVSLKESEVINEDIERQINEGFGRSLALGGTLSIDKNLKKIAAFISLSVFFPRKLVKFILKNRFYKIIPSFIFILSQRFVRVVLVSPFARLFIKKSTYDAGLRRCIRPYLSYFKLIHLLR